MIVIENFIHSYMNRTNITIMKNDRLVDNFKYNFFRLCVLTQIFRNFHLKNKKV